MGWTLKQVQFTHNGASTVVHADGNNAAWVCASCGAPVLLVYQNGRVGSGPQDRSTCRGCGSKYHLSPAYGSQPEPPRGSTAKPAPVMQIV